MVIYIKDLTPIKNKSSYNSIRIYPAQMNTQNFGKIRVKCTTAGFAPVENATVNISPSDIPYSLTEQLTTDQSGLTGEIELPAPPLEYSMEPSIEQPYAEYTINVTSPEYASVTIANSEILPDVTALQNVTLTQISTEKEEKLYVVPPHTLYGDYPPKIAETEIKDTSETGEIVLTQVVVPEYVIVHDGPPSDTSAANHYVKFLDYVKNVASSEIYATWSDSTINANVLAILSFTLNRVYTEWYRNKGYNFTITSSTAFDHKWIAGRNIYSNISQTVDQIFVNYLSRPNIKQPILTQYCDGYKVQCPNWMTQWGSKDLGDQGYTAIDILRNFYGDSIYINTATEVSGIPSSWPGTELTIGSSGSSVKMIQEQLNQISNTYSVIPKNAVDSNYSKQTSKAVKIFQRIFELPQTGVVDRATWYQISNIYVAVTRIAE
jgi:peptidoglycan hydrolase-like protein with peptidoglycan-binding domain